MYLLPSGNDIREPEDIAQWQQSKTEVYEVEDLGQHRDIFWVILAMG